MPLKRRSLRFLLGLTITLLLLGKLLSGLDTAALLTAAWNVPLHVWLGAAAGVLASHALRALRLQAEWKPRVGVEFGPCLRLALLHNAAVVLLPMRAGEMGYAWWLHRKWDVPLTEALGSLLWLRLQDLVVLVSLAAVLWLPGHVSAPVLLLAAVVGFALMPRWLRRWSTRPSARPADATTSPVTAAPAIADPAAEPPRKLAARLRRITTAVLHAATTRRGGWAPWIYAGTNWTLRLLVVGYLLVAIGPLEALDAVRGAMGGELAALLPVQGPAGLGTYEAGVWIGAHLLTPSVPTEVAQLAGTALLVHLWWLFVGLAAAAMALLLPRLRPLFLYFQNL